MPATEQKRNKLMDKLKELFQLDQPDLDFGFYRIMHAKADQIKQFIEEDLLGIIGKSFDALKEKEALDKLAEIRQKVLDQLGAEAINEKGELQGLFASTPIGREYLAARKEQKAVAGSSQAESDIFDDLYRFFERYYEGGDFISRRYFSSETKDKAATYSIPYSGEEVKLHWANSDQYYIKTAEYFSNFTFNLSVAAKEQFEKNKAGKEAQPEELISLNIPEKMLVHFRIREASEGEHGNVKESENSKRFFIIHAQNPVELSEEEGLIINFEFRADPEKTGQESSHRDKRNAEAVVRIIKELELLVSKNSSASQYLSLLKISAPTEKEKKRPLLAKYIYQYTSRNTMDYFIHKDLGGFLRRELDFYIKNEVMRLDDIEKAEATAVETYLSRIKVLRAIAHKLIDFLAQLEDFQKKLWLKKKFVVETNYCITLDRVPEELYPEIAANQAQHDEWINLFAINKIEADTLGNPGYVYPMTVEFLKANNKLVLDTRFFDDSFKARLLSSIENFDEQCDGLLIHSNNASALSLIVKRYHKQLKTIYIDPPYNTESNAILYKNSYKHSSWLSLMSPLLDESKKIEKTDDGVHCIAIDSAEVHHLIDLVNDTWPQKECTIVSVIHNPGGTMGKNFSGSGEYALFIHSPERKVVAMENRDENPDVRDLMNTAKGKSDNYLRESGKNCFYPILVKGNDVVGFGDICADDFHPKRNVVRDDGTIEIYPIDSDGVERKWVLARNTVESCREELSVKIDRKTGEVRIERCKNRINYKTIWTNNKYSAKKYGTELVGDIVPLTKVLPPLYPKSIHLVSDCIHASLNGTIETPILDYFAGSGTTGHAVINLNREDGGYRKYILVEMGNHFDNILKPRIVKVVYSESWKDGRPVARHTGISHCFKYLRLESYEDTLNNLRFEENSVRDKVVNGNSSLKEDFMLRYFLNVETQGSNSLLNIDAFADPTAYTLKVKKPGSDEYTVKNVDLIETFNYLIGLRVNHTAAPQTFTASFERKPDPDLPDDQETKLCLNSKFKQDENGKWWFCKVEGWVPKNPDNPNNGLKDKVLIVWRRLTGNLEQDNLMLDEWMEKQRINSRDFEFDIIYVNGSDNLPNIKRDTENWKVKKIEEEFMKRMWEVE